MVRERERESDREKGREKGMLFSLRLAFSFTKSCV
jgi:hypothetical protein